MKKFLLITLLFPLFCSAQSVQTLDIKNGFLQFHLGDSLSLYKNYIYVANTKHPDENEVKSKALTLGKYLDKVTLVSKNGIVTEIDIMIREEASEEFIDKLLLNAYGNGYELPNDDKDEPGTHLVCTTWTGQRVTAMLIQTNLNRMVNNHLTRARLQSLVFTKTSDVSINGALPVDFPL